MNLKRCDVSYKVIVVLLALSAHRTFSSGLSENVKKKDINRIPLKILNELPKIDSSNRLSEIRKQIEHEQNQKLNLSPASFSGPDYLKDLIGMCYSYLDEKYKYKCCFFSNVTQEEVQSLQEPYKGVLGVWGEWIIVNNTFKALHFIEGNKCGSGLKRNIKIKLDCGIRNRLKEISEPTKCGYEGTFESPLFCGTNALVVYPRLNKELQHNWNLVETEKHYNILTEKGYERALQNIFTQAGFLLTPEVKRTLNVQSAEDATHLSCERAKESLERRVEELEEELELKNQKLKEMIEEFKQGNKLK